MCFSLGFAMFRRIFLFFLCGPVWRHGQGPGGHRAEGPSVQELSHLGVQTARQGRQTGGQRRMSHKGNK